MEYATGRAGAGVPLAVSNQAIEVKALDALLDRMNKELHGLAENTARLANFKNRLLNPRPQGVSEKQPEPPAPGSVEGRMHMLIQLANNIGAHLNEIATELDRAA